MSPADFGILARVYISLVMFHKLTKNVFCAWHNAHNQRICLKGTRAGWDERCQSCLGLKFRQNYTSVGHLTTSLPLFDASCLVDEWKFWPWQPHGERNKKQIQIYLPTMNKFIWMQGKTLPGRGCWRLWAYPLLFAQCQTKKGADLSRVVFGVQDPCANFDQTMFGFCRWVRPILESKSPLVPLHPSLIDSDIPLVSDCPLQTCLSTDHRK